MIRGPIDAVVFDLGGVLIDWNPRHLYRTFFDDDAAMERFLAEVCTPAWNLEQDRGRPVAEATRDLQARNPHEAERIAAYYGRWTEMLGGPIAGTVDLLAGLRATEVRLLALTNWSHETFAIARPRFDFLEWFEDIVVSGEEGLVKPEAAIYERLIARNRLVAERALFVDDAEHNVAGARAVGMQAVRFESPGQLAAVLRNAGLLQGTGE